MTTTRLSWTVTDMQPQRCRGHEFELLESCDVIDHVTVGSAYPEYPILEHISHVSDICSCLAENCFLPSFLPHDAVALR